MPPETSKLQRVVGRYAIHGEIAAGGMATVHYGRLLGPVGFSRAVAVKRLHPQYAKDPEFVDMFLDEARLASRILHANVVSILDVVSEDGELFLVMEYVEGETLSRLVRGHVGPLPIPIAIAISVGMLEGLQAAHEARDENNAVIAMVHRDVSPQNVLIGTDGVVRVIDFGVAKAVGNSRVTREGQIKGKISYMAPEQILSEPVDRRADVYAASIVLWEMLAGRRLFAGAENDVAVIRRAVEGVTDPPSSYRAEVPKALDQVVLRGMARAKDDRFPTAREMAQALECIVVPAATRDVGAWVSKVAEKSVSARAAQVREMEAASQIIEVQSLATPALSAPNVVASTAARAIAPIVQASSETGARAPDRPMRRNLIAAFALVAALLVGFYIARALPGASTEATATATTTTTATTPMPSSKPSEAPSSEPSVAAVSPSATTRASAVAETPHAAKPAARPSVVRPPARSADCSPPYIVTPDGVREYKPNCLQ